MTKNSIALGTIIATALLVALGACSSEVGPDTISSHSTEAYDGDTSNCATCHSPDSGLDPRTTSGEGPLGKHLVHVVENLFSCETCHSSYPDAAIHRDGSLDAGSPGFETVGFDSTNPEGIWEFDVASGSGTCSATACHGPSTVDWYGTAGWSLPGCATCHASALAHTRQVLGAGGDFSRASHHVIDYDDRTSQIIVSGDCLVCHDMSGHMSGTVALTHADTGHTILYDPTAPATAESFCLSCHDADGATASADSMSPFSSTSVLGEVPNAAGTRISESWGKANGHNSNGLTCLGTGDPATGCHGGAGQPNAHGSSNYGLLAQNMNFGIDGSAAFSEYDYLLCFSCHGGYPGIRKEDILGVQAGGNYDYELAVDLGKRPGGSLMVFGYPPYYNNGLQTRFVDTEAQFHSFNNPEYQYQLHWFHLSMRVSGDFDVWLYRGEGMPASSCSDCHSTDPVAGRKATCTACHDVHGSDTPFGMVYDELSLTHDAGDTTGYLGTDDIMLQTAPMNCGTAECHVNRLSSRNYVFSPTGE